MKPRTCLLFTQALATLLVMGCTTVKEYTSPVEVRAAANSSFKDWERLDFYVGGLNTWVAPKAAVTRNDILFATEDTNAFGEQTVTLQFTSYGAAVMDKLSTERMSRPVAVLLDGKIIAAPVLAMPVSNTLTINFGKSKEGVREARALEEMVNERSDSGSGMTSAN